jgi:phosphopantothenoylcysteine decarboxylase/phosphopantothenate--cysteine ligase
MAERPRPPAPPSPWEAAATRAGAEGSAARRPTVALVVTGSVAAYKAVMVARLLVQAGARVLPVMTRGAAHFVGPLTLSGITGEPVHVEMFDPAFPGELHVDLASAADLVLVVPATADFLARLAEGRADDLSTALVLCARGPVLAAPAMHPRMWSHPATQRNVRTLAADGRVTLVGPVEGEVASGERGLGRMAEPEAIVAAAMAALAPQDLRGRRVVVTAGPTVEDLDPVRFIGNRSTGKMGFAVAARAAARGAKVTLISGPVALPTPHAALRVDVRTALEMRAALWTALGGKKLAGADALIMVAAVADYRPARTQETKIKRAPGATSLGLVANPDLVAEVGAARRGTAPVLVAFAVETADDAGVVAAARKKLASKKVDLVVANHAADSFGRDDDRATLVDATGAHPLGVLDKHALADRILDRVLGFWRPGPRRTRRSTR